MYLTDAIRLRILELIKANHINGNKLSVASGINRSTINKFLRCQSNSIKIETITLICQSLNITLKDFFDNELFIDVEIKD